MRPLSTMYLATFIKPFPTLHEILMDATSLQEKCQKPNRKSELKILQQKNTGGGGGGEMETTQKGNKENGMIVY